MSSVSQLHKSKSPTSAGVYILTCSTSKYKQLKRNERPDDESGDVIEKLSTQAGHTIVGRTLIADSISMIRHTVRSALRNGRVDVIVITGGTGLSRTDVTFEAVSPLLEKHFPGFGEIFRRVSYDEIGSAAMMSRAFGGTIGSKAIFCLPGSPNGVKTAMVSLIAPELGHIIGLVRGA